MADVSSVENAKMNGFDFNTDAFRPPPNKKYRVTPVSEHRDQDVLPPKLLGSLLRIAAPPLPETKESVAKLLAPYKQKINAGRTSSIIQPRVCVVHMDMGSQKQQQRRTRDSTASIPCLGLFDICDSLWGLLFQFCSMHDLIFCIASVNHWLQSLVVHSSMWKHRAKCVLPPQIYSYQSNTSAALVQHTLDMLFANWTRLQQLDIVLPSKCDPNRVTAVWRKLFTPRPMIKRLRIGNDKKMTAEDAGSPQVVVTEAAFKYLKFARQLEIIDFSFDMRAISDAAIVEFFAAQAGHHYVVPTTAVPKRRIIRRVPRQQPLPQPQQQQPAVGDNQGRPATASDGVLIASETLQSNRRHVHQNSSSCNDIGRVRNASISSDADDADAGHVLHETRKRRNVKKTSQKRSRNTAQCGNGKLEKDSDDSESDDADANVDNSCHNHNDRNTTKFQRIQQRHEQRRAAVCHRRRSLSFSTLRTSRHCTHGSQRRQHRCFRAPKHRDRNEHRNHDTPDHHNHNHNHNHNRSQPQPPQPPPQHKTRRGEYQRFPNDSDSESETATPSSSQATTMDAFAKDLSDTETETELLPMVVATASRQNEAPFDIDPALIATLRELPDEEFRLALGANFTAEDYRLYLRGYLDQVAVQKTKMQNLGHLSSLKRVYFRECTNKCFSDVAFQYLNVDKITTLSFCNNVNIASLIAFLESGESAPNIRKLELDCGDSAQRGTRYAPLCDALMKCANLYSLQLPAMVDALNVIALDRLLGNSPSLKEFGLTNGERQLFKPLHEVLVKHRFRMAINQRKLMYIYCKKKQSTA